MLGFSLAKRRFEAWIFRNVTSIRRAVFGLRAVSASVVLAQHVALTAP